VVKALFDTNVLIDYLNAVPQARAELDRYEVRAISIVTWMEVMVGADEAVASATRAFLDGFDLVALDQEVAERAVALRQTHRIKLPDAVVWASAQTQGALLVTRNAKDFPSGDPGVRLPYKL
jgi:predicted nucleic acid-binding protein